MAEPERAPRFFPREHGAYGQLGCPLVTALAIGDASPAAFCLAAGVLFAFVAHEPLLVLTGRRGGRVLREHGARARTALVLRGVAALALGVSGLLMAGRPTLIAATVPAALLVPFSALLFAGHEKTATGELLAACTFSATSLPVAIAAHVSWPLAVQCAATWAIASSVGTIAVRAVISRSKVKRGALAAWMTAAGAAACVAGAWSAWTRGAVVWAVPIALAGPALVAVVLAAVPPATRNLRRVGWALVAVTLVGVALLTVGLRSAHAGP